MITGMHAIVYTKHVKELHEFFGDILEWPSVDAGNGRLIFAAPPTELGIHETEEEPEHELYLICDDIAVTLEKLRARGVAATPVADRGWGLVTSLTLPGGEQIGLYQQKHLSPLTRR
jgi:predicted enzyme related to lactoylglutathione lyase